MAELLSPGVFIEEVPATTQVVGPVSTSNMGLISWTPKGPTDKATLVTNFDQFVKTFGNFDRRSFGCYAMAAFFSNGGRRAFMVRVAPANAVAAQAKIQSLTTGQDIELGDGTTATFTKTSATSVLKDNTGASPLTIGQFTARYRATQTAVTGQYPRKRDNATILSSATAVSKYDGRVDSKSTLVVTGASSPNGDLYIRSIADARQDITVEVVVAGNNTVFSIVVTGTAIVINSATDGGGLATTTAAAAATAIGLHAQASLLISATALGTGLGLLATFAATNLRGVPLFDAELDRIVPGTLTITWMANSLSKSIAFTGVDLAEPVATKTNGAGSSITIDLRSGIFSLTTDATETPVLADNGIAMTVAYTPASTTKVITSDTTANAADNMGLLQASLTGGGNTTASLTTPPGATQSYVNVADGSYQLSFTAGATNVPHQKGRVLATYKINAWTANPISVGVWGNSLKIQVKGSPNYFTASTQQYTRFDVFVMETDANGQDVIQETYEELVFDDPTSIYFFADIINEFSNLITIVEPAGNEAPGELQGLLNTVYIAGGDDDDNSRVIMTSLTGNPIARRSLKITYTDSAGTARTITDDGAGNLTGDVDVTYVGATANTVNYTTGAVDFKTVAVTGPLGIQDQTLVKAEYRTIASETAHTESFGNTVKGYTVGTDGTFDSTNFGRNRFTDPILQTDYKGLYALSRIDELMQVIIPDFAGDVTVTGDLIDYADARAAQPCGGDRFIILTVPKGSDAQEAVDWFRNKLGRYSNFAALYWPWINVADPLANGRKLTMPGVGHVAGIYARTDVNRNVGKSPGGTVDGQLNFLLGLEMVPTQGERDFVYPNKINPFISSTQTGNAVWGVRTIALDSQWRYINARRLFMFLEKSIYNSTFWIVFENNGPGLWARIKAQIQGFLVGLFNDGYFAGTSSDQAFFVICDETNNTAASINAGQVIIDVGIAPNKPAEFVRFRFQQITVG